MKRAILVLLLVAFLLSLTLAIVGAAMDEDDPCTPGAANTTHAKCLVPAPPGLGGNTNGKAGNNWLPPQ